MPFAFARTAVVVFVVDAGLVGEGIEGSNRGFAPLLKVVPWARALAEGNERVGKKKRLKEVKKKTLAQCCVRMVCRGAKSDPSQPPVLPICCE